MTTGAPNPQADAGVEVAAGGGDGSARGLSHAADQAPRAAQPPSSRAGADGTAQPGRARRPLRRPRRDVRLRPLGGRRPPAPRRARTTDVREVDRRLSTPTTGAQLTGGGGPLPVAQSDAGVSTGRATG